MLREKNAVLPRAGLSTVTSLRVLQCTYEYVAVTENVIMRMLYYTVQIQTRKT